MNYLNSVMITGEIAKPPKTSTTDSGTTRTVVHLRGADDAHLEIIFYEERANDVMRCQVGELVTISGYLRSKRTQTERGGVFYNTSVIGLMIARVDAMRNGEIADRQSRGGAPSQARPASAPRQARTTQPQQYDDDSAPF